MGRLGNHLFQFNFLKQLERKIASPKSSSRAFLGSNYFRGMRLSRPEYFFDPRRIILTKEDLSNMGYEAFADKCREYLEQQRNVEIPSGILGEFFDESTVLSPREIFKNRNRVSKAVAKSAYNQERIAVVHFRGTDLISWNSDAVSDYRYYRESLDHFNDLNKNLERRIIMVTDDPSHETVQEILRNTEVTLSSGKDDFLTLLSADHIIGSASTFSLWGAMLGKKKTISLPQKWIQNRVETNDKFWVNLINADRNIIDITAVI